ncbi:MAG: tRNA nucleotidyltransferase [Wendovervirus sonii]|uniref:tRNA nucleotidyltransferase n=1 Tax=phage Lak_Megaphage_Sonny TaxID=3109229 RepID=A0ABZ0Z2J9_9CAUD|nr:MAG: tRNA nucleotidyltransferase [phage Lak_Megaphage_Sonny]
MDYTLRPLSHSEFFHLFQAIGKVADSLSYPCYVVGGFVRDFLLCKSNDDLDFVVVGSGLTMAKEVAKALHASKVDLYENYGTAKVNVEGYELEFVGARKEFYHRESRKPIVENGTIDDDMNRRDLTINDIAICINIDKFGEYYDPHNGLNDLKDRICRTPLDPDITFSDDPLRMLRCIRFACRFNFDIDDNTFDGICNNAERIKIISKERIVDELMKMIAGFNPARAMSLLYNTKLMQYIMPDIYILDNVQVRNGVTHKNILHHTIDVLRYTADHTEDVWVRWAALFHDVGKIKARKWVNGKDSMEGKGRGQWTFESHAQIGARMLPKIFRDMKLPESDERLKKVQTLVELHMRPMQLCVDGVTDSAVRRLLFEAGEYINDLMVLCNADITTSHLGKAENFRNNYNLLVNRMHEIEEADHIRNFQPVIDGNMIMSMFNLQPCKTVGILKDSLKNAILDGIIKNEYDVAKQFLINTYNDIQKDQEKNK